jgi:antitoxin VapB
MEVVMAFHIRDAEADRLVRDLAKAKGVSMTEAVKSSARRELERVREELRAKQSPDIREGIRMIQERVAARGRTGLKADKAFYDWLSGDE